MTREEYREYLNSPEWAAIKAAIRDRDKVCKDCGATSNLAVHHITYEHLKNEMEHLDDLILVCRTCHDFRHGFKASEYGKCFVNRDKGAEHVATISKAVAQNKTLSYSARGVLLYLLSNRHDWAFSQVTVLRNGPDGKCRVNAIFRELEQAGYLVAREGKDGKKIVMQSGIWRCYEKPVPESLRSNRTKWKSAKPRHVRPQPMSAKQIAYIDSDIASLVEDEYVD